MIDVLDNAYATAAVSADKTLAMVYLPTARTITRQCRPTSCGYPRILDRPNQRRRDISSLIAYIYLTWPEQSRGWRLAAAVLTKRRITVRIFAARGLIQVLDVAYQILVA